MKTGTIVNGKYSGTHGRIDISCAGYKYGNCMFYSDRGRSPYRVCVKLSDVIFDGGDHYVEKE